MKIKLAENDTFSAYLVNGNGPLRMEFSIGKDSQPRILGPSDYVFQPAPASKGTTAAEWLADWVADDEGRSRSVVEIGKRKSVQKFIAAGKTLKSDDEIEKEKAKRERENQIEYTSMKLHELSSVLEFVMESHTIEGSGASAEDFNRLRDALGHLAPCIIEESNKLYELVHQ